MPPVNLHGKFGRTWAIYMMLKMIFAESPDDSSDSSSSSGSDSDSSSNSSSSADSERAYDAYLDSLGQEFAIDMRVLLEIKRTRYLRGRTPVLKLGNLELAWEYAKDHHDHGRFIEMLRVSPQVRSNLALFPVIPSNS